MFILDTNIDIDISIKLDIPKPINYLSSYKKTKKIK